MAEDQNTLDAFARTKVLLKDNLGLKLGTGPNSLDNRLWNHIQEFGGDDNALLLWIYEQEEFKQRYPALEKLKAKGRAITPGQYQQLESSYRSAMKTSGVPSKFFDKADDFTDLIVADVNPDEFRQRLVDGYDKVAKTDPLVRQTFKDYFGIEGDAALAAYFIDPDRSTPELLRRAQEAQIGAAAKNSLGKIDLNYASRLAEMGVSYKQATDSFAKLSSMSSLFETGLGETQVGEKPQVLNFMNDVGVAPGGTQSPIIKPVVAGDTKAELAADFAFGVNSKNQKELELRLAQRKSQFDGESQQTSVNKQGETGIGSAF